ncbi:FAD-dependent oxidoreductase [Neisseria sp. Dent CA1/247]|uniref:NAD(P)-binding protein n=1 Tax=Neisseria sp. Dent CA1/247 TaxID=2912675 RepID=UPI001FD56355|nr:NAD(P)-binding protein [Neisseria sp. Dent CA1/247]UOO76391.1 FAD-dependent oxidoreductase [Neisseria sp. Dent CA1/247]
MKRKLSRRAFLAGSAAVTGTAMLGGYKIYKLFSPQTLESSVNAAVNATYYPPALLGLRGDADGVQRAAHSVALQNKPYTLPGAAEEEYDLVVVGAGISGLTAAYLYQQQRPQAKILILDNHDDFGGHAQRNEFTVNGRLLISYAGSESIDSPKSEYSKESLALLKELGIDYNKFEQYFHQDLYETTRKLKEGVFFSQASFGKNTVVRGIPEAGEESAADIIKQFPLPDADKKALTELYTSATDYLEGKTDSERISFAENTSYYNFLKNEVQLPEGALKYLKNISSEYWGHAINAISVQEAFEDGYPGVQNLGLEKEESEEEPYIYHFPDGNASIARMLVRKLIPAVAPGYTMEDVVLAKFDYSKLDLPENRVRLRLNSTALLMENQPDGSVAVAYMPHDAEALKQVSAKKAIFAGHSVLAARVIPQMPDAQKAAAQTTIKVPMVYGKVVVKNSKAFQKLGVHSLYAPDAPYCLVKLDDPVSMGGYQFPQTADEPMVIHMVRIATDFTGQTARDMYKSGRRALNNQSYESLEKEMLDQLRSIYDAAGEKLDSVLVAVTLNRWAHGYSYEQTGLWDSDSSAENATSTMQQQIGNIFIAGADAAWMPYVHGAIDQAYRAVAEALA